MRIQTKMNIIDTAAWLIIVACVMLFSFAAHASLSRVDEHNAIFTDIDGTVYDIFNSTVLDHSCRLTIPATCSVFDVGQFIYASVHASVIEEDLLRRVLSENTGQLDLRNNPMWFYNPDFNLNSITCDFLNPTIPAAVFNGGAVCGSTALEFMTATVKLDPPPPSAVPVPAALILFGSGLIGLALVARRKV